MEFIDGISTDKYGQMALKQLHKDGVLLDFVKFSDKPTCLAIVSLNKAGGASYEFVIDGTATFDFSATVFVVSFSRITTSDRLQN